MDMHTQQEKASILLKYAGVEETGVFGGHDTVRSSDGLLGDGAGLVDEDRENHRR